MVKENAVVQLGIKGSDIVLSTFKKIDSAKNKFGKMASMALGGMSGALAKAPTTTPEQAKQPLAQGEKTSQALNKLGTIAKETGGALKGVAGAAASMDAASFLVGASDAIGAAARGLGTVGAIAGIATSIASTSVQIASGALNAIKAAQGSAIDTLEKRSRQKFFGGGSIFAGTGQKFSMDEQAQVLNSVVGRFGKVTERFGREIGDLLKSGKDYQQVSAVAGGNYSALGTDKGFFMQKIADQFSNLPPSLAQNLNSQIFGSLDKSEFQEDEARDVRSTRAQMDNQDREAQVERANTSIKGALALNQAFNTLTNDLIRVGSNLDGVVTSFANGIDKTIKKVEAVAATLDKVGAAISGVAKDVMKFIGVKGK